MTTPNLRDYIITKTKRLKQMLYLCFTASALFSCVQGTIFFYKLKNDTSEKKSLSFFLDKLQHLLLAFFSLSLLGISLKEIKKLPKNKKRTPTVSDNILAQLSYGNMPRDCSNDIYNPLTPNDIKNLVQKLDFSNLKEEEQHLILQNIIIVSDLSPFVAKIIKSDFQTSTIRIDNELNFQGTAKFLPEIISNGLISLKIPEDPIAIAHEIFHLKQAYDGAHASKYFYHYTHLLNEAQAEGINFITKFNLYQGYAKVNKTKNPLPKWEKDLFYTQLNHIKKKYPTLSEREQQAKGEELLIGVLMKCLLESDEQKREEIFKNACKKNLTYNDRIDFNAYISRWRNIYINEHVLMYEEKINNILQHQPQIVQQDLERVPLFEAYFTNETGVPQSISEIKLSKKNPYNALYTYQKTTRQKE